MGTNRNRADGIGWSSESRICPPGFLYSRAREYGFATKWKSVRVAGRFRWRIRTEIRSSCSSPPRSRLALPWPTRSSGTLPIGTARNHLAHPPEGSGALGSTMPAALLFGEPHRLRRQVVALGNARGPFRRRAIVCNGLIEISQPLAEMSSHRIEAIVPRDPSIGIERLQQLEPDRRPVHHRRGDRAIERDHGVVRQLHEQPVVVQNRGPVRVLGPRRLIVKGRDGSLNLIHPHFTTGEGGRKAGHAFGDQALVPEGAILLIEWNQLAGSTGSCRPACIGQQHQRE